MRGGHCLKNMYQEAAGRIAVLCRERAVCRSQDRVRRAGDPEIEGEAKKKTRECSTRDNQTSECKESLLQDWFVHRGKTSYHSNGSRWLLHEQ